MKSLKLPNTVTIILEHFKRAEIGRQAAELAYYVLLALFPLLLNGISNILLDVALATYC